MRDTLVVLQNLCFVFSKPPVWSYAARVSEYLRAEVPRNFARLAGQLGAAGHCQNLARHIVSLLQHIAELDGANPLA